MAVELNDKMIDFACKNLYGKSYNKFHKNNKITILINYFLEFKLRLKVYLINVFRSINLLFYKKDTAKIELDIKTCLRKNSELIASEMSNKGYVFLNNFINSEFNNYFNENFPDKNLFRKSKLSLKNYNMGFKYVKGKKDPDLSKSSVIKKFYNFILSEKFEDEINYIFKKNDKKLICKNIIASYAEESSFLIPHKDSISREINNTSINLIYFIDGNNELLQYSGATFISEDNEAVKYY